MPETKRTASGVLGGLAGLVGLSAVAGVLITATVTPAIAVTGNAASSALEMFDNLPSVLEIDKLMLPTTLYWADGTEMAKFYDQNRSPVEFDQVNPVMYDAILSSEDPRYYQHGGVDLIGTTRAVLTNLQGSGDVQGGSSISQQYVKNILIQRCEQNAEATETQTQEEVLQNCWTEATTASGNEGIQRKLQEMRYAISLEQKYSKNDILLGYLNIANFGGTNYGIDAAAKYYFGVDAANVTLAQAATLAGIVQNPNFYKIDNPASEQNGAPDGEVTATGNQIAALDSMLASGEITEEQYVAAADGYTLTKGRQLYVLSRMLDDGKITKEQYTAAAIEPITPVITPATTGCAAAGGAAYFCQYVKNIIKTDPAFGETPDERNKALQRGGLNIYTTLDANLQAAAQQAMWDWAPSSIEGWVDVNTGVFGATVASVENTTGRILAIAQNTAFSESASTVGDPNYSSLVYAGDMKYGRSNGFEAGSTFKVFTLVDWLEKGHSLNEVINGRVRVIPRLTNSCDGDWVNVSRDVIRNFNGVGGHVGTPMQFTASSLNSGFFAMAEKLDLCDIKNVATKMGVTLGNGDPVAMNSQMSIVGSNNVTPLGMAGAYGTIANNGIYCQPRAIDRIVDSDGQEMTPPVTTCTQVLDPAVASTAAFALQGVMNGGTGRAANPYDGTPLLGKTGTHEQYQTWMVESSTQVATAVWVGNSIGKGDLFRRSYNGMRLSDLRSPIAEAVQHAANMAYGGNRFPDADSNLTRQVLTDLPNVIGMSVGQATETLENAGFQVIVGSPVDSSEGQDIVVAQDPGAGRVGGGIAVTISPSNGQGLAVPDVAGRQLDRAMNDLRSAGFGNVQPGTCTPDENADRQERATGTAPAAGSVVNRNAAITVNYTSRECGDG